MKFIGTVQCTQVSNCSALWVHTSAGQGKVGSSLSTMCISAHSAVVNLIILSTMCTSAQYAMHRCDKICTLECFSTRAILCTLQHWIRQSARCIAQCACIVNSTILWNVQVTFWCTDVHLQPTEHCPVHVDIDKNALLCFLVFHLRFLCSTWLPDHKAFWVLIVGPL